MFKNKLNLVGKEFEQDGTRKRVQNDIACQWYSKIYFMYFSA